MKKIISIISASFIMAISCAGFADPVGGQKVGSGFLRPGESEAFSIPLRSNETTVIYAIGDGDGDLDCRLYDDNGNLVDSDTDSQDNCVVRVSPRWPAFFRLVVTNAGRISENYIVTAQ